MTDEMKLFYAPKIPASDDIMLRIKHYCRPLVLKGFDTENEMVANMYKYDDYVGIVFDNLPFTKKANVTFPKNLHYRIRTKMYPKSLISTMSAHEWPFRAYTKEIYFKNFLGKSYFIHILL